MFKISKQWQENAAESARNPSETINLLEDDGEIEPTDSDATPEAAPEAPSRFFYQVMIAGICLLILMMMTGSNQPWAQWVKGKMHTAFFASTETTFGYLSHWGPLQSLMQNGKNLIKLEEITKQFSSGDAAWTPKQEPQDVSLPNPVWPVQGNVSRSFGWQYNSAKKTREFNEGMEISALPGVPVQALADGRVVEITRQQDFSWQVSLNHGNGWISVYRNLGLVKVKVGENIPSGASIGSLNTFGPSGTKLWLQVKHNNQVVDPMTLFVN